MNKLPLLILCAGFGKRMQDLTKYTPKPLLQFKNKILLGNTINFFKNIGFSEIYINTHYLSHKIENYIHKYYKDTSINLIYEPQILGTGGGIKNIFNYTKSNKMCVVNSDIFWHTKNKKDIINFLENFNEINYCKISLSKESSFLGLKKNKGDFSIINDNIITWRDGSELIFYSGFQIVTKKIFKNTAKIFPMNDIWKKLIINKKLKGNLFHTNVLHIGDKNTFHKL